MEINPRHFEVTLSFTGKIFTEFCKVSDIMIQ